MQYRPELLGPRHIVSDFSCGGEETLDRFLKNEALTANNRGLSRTYVWQKDLHVVAYFTVFPLTIGMKSLTKREHGGISGGIPGFSIGKLALDASLRGKGLGADLLIDAIGIIVKAADLVGGRVIFVTAANNQAWSFYRSAGFEEVPSSYEMWMLVDDARLSLSGAAGNP